MVVMSTFIHINEKSIFPSILFSFLYIMHMLLDLQFMSQRLNKRFVTSIVTTTTNKPSLESESSHHIK